MIISPKEDELYKDYIDRILSVRENIKNSVKYMERHHIIPPFCFNVKANRFGFLLLPYGIVVERFSIRDFVADCPIHIIFKHSRLCFFHHCVVVYMT